MLPSREDLNRPNKGESQKNQLDGLDFLQQNEIQVNKTVEHYLKRDNTVMNWLQSTFLPSKVQKLVNRKEVRLAEDALEFKRNLFKLGNDFKLEGMHEKYNIGLKGYKAYLRQDLFNWIMDLQNELAEKVRQQEEKFLQQIEEKEKLCERYAHLERAVKRYRQKIEQEEDRFFNWVDKIIADYQNIIDEELKKHGIEAKEQE